MNLNKMHLTIALILTLLVIVTKARPRIESPGKNSLFNLEDPLVAAASDDVPMVHNNNYEMVMATDDDDATDHLKSEATMELQNFNGFYDPEIIDYGEYNMDETKFIRDTPVRPPQPLNAEELRIREKLEKVDVQHERKAQKKLKKGSSRPLTKARLWEHFDYDQYSVNPSSQKKIYG